MTCSIILYVLVLPVTRALVHTGSRPVISEISDTCGASLCDKGLGFSCQKGKGLGGPIHSAGNLSSPCRSVWRRHGGINIMVVLIYVPARQSSCPAVNSCNSWNCSPGVGTERGSRLKKNPAPLGEDTFLSSFDFCGSKSPS